MKSSSKVSTISTSLYSVKNPCSLSVLSLFEKFVCRPYPMDLFATNARICFVVRRIRFRMFFQCELFSSVSPGLVPSLGIVDIYSYKSDDIPLENLYIGSLRKIKYTLTHECIAASESIESTKRTGFIGLWCRISSITSLQLSFPKISWVWKNLLGNLHCKSANLSEWIEQMCHDDVVTALLF